MRVECGKHWLSLEKTGVAANCAVWLLDGCLRHPPGLDLRITRTLQVDTALVSLAALTDFARLNQPHLEFVLPNGGWLHLKRGHDGGMLVAFRITQHPDDTSFVEGQIPVRPEAASATCRELKGLL